MISIQKQKIIRFIPLVNLIIFFVWFGVINKNRTSFSGYLKALGKIFLCIAISALIIYPTTFIKVQWLSSILRYFVFYLAIVTSTSVAIDAQKKILMVDFNGSSQKFISLSKELIFEKFYKDNEDFFEKLEFSAQYDVDSWCWHITGQVKLENDDKHYENKIPHALIKQNGDVVAVWMDNKHSNGIM